MSAKRTERPAGAEQRRSGPSQRQLRVGEQMRHVLAETFVRRELHDPVLLAVSLTVSEVRISPDLRSADVFLSELGRDAPARETIKALARAASRLGGKLAREMHLKYAPRLRFHADQSFATADRVERLIAAETAKLPPAEDAP